MQNSKNILLAVIYFLLSTVITGIFITSKFWLYPSVNAMLISGIIAGMKWFMQMAAAWFFLGKEKWHFIRRMGVTCLVGSMLLFTFDFMKLLSVPISGFSQFITAIAVSILIMTILYYRAVIKTGLDINWFFAWVICLTTAITLQLTIVFK